MRTTTIFRPQVIYFNTAIYQHLFKAFSKSIQFGIIDSNGDIKEGIVVL